MAFGLDPSEGGDVILLDQYNTPIEKDAFGVIVRQFKNCGHFYINFMLRSDENTNFDTRLEVFLKESGCKEIFIEANRAGSLKQKEISLLCDKLISYMDSIFNDTSQDVVEQVCRSAVRLLPCLKKEPSLIGGIVSDFTNNLW